MRREKENWRGQYRYVRRVSNITLSMDLYGSNT
jgi:hypothetical protein